MEDCCLGSTCSCLYVSCWTLLRLTTFLSILQHISNSFTPKAAQLRFILIHLVFLLTKFNVQHSTMSPVLPFDIIALIIDNVGEDDTNILKELALVSHSFLEISSKYLFATIELHDADSKHHVASSKKGFVKLLRSKPDVVKYIRNLTYNIERDHVQSQLPQFSPHLNIDNDDNLLSPILPNILRTISRLNCFKISASLLDWNHLNASLTSAFLHLMHLPTTNHIDLSSINNFPLPSLTLSVGLLRLDMSRLICSDVDRLEEDGSPEFVVQSEMRFKIREFHTTDSSQVTMELLHTKMQDGRPAFNLMYLRRLSLSSISLEDNENMRYLLQNAKSLEKLHLCIEHQSFVDLRGILSLSALTLKVFGLSISLSYSDALAHTGLLEELEAMAGQNTLEALSIEIQIDGNPAEDDVGSIFWPVEEVLVKPGWSALRQVSFKVEIIPAEYSAKLSEALQSLPDKYLSHLPKHESIAFNFSAYTSTRRGLLLDTNNFFLYS